MLSKNFSKWVKSFSAVPLKRGTRLSGVLKNFIHSKFFFIISFKNSGKYCCASFIFSRHNKRYLVKKIKSFELLDNVKPSLSKCDLTNFSNSFIPISKLFLYSLNIMPDIIIAVKTSNFFTGSFSNLKFFFKWLHCKIIFWKKIFLNSKEPLFIIISTLSIQLITLELKVEVSQIFLLKCEFLIIQW